MQHRRLTTTSAAVMSGLLLGLALIGANGAYARSDEGWRNGPDMGFDPRIERMTDQLDLTEDQQTQIHGIMDEARKQREQLRLEVRKQIEAVLTQEQKAKREAMLKERMDRRLERMTDQLDLSDEQVAKLRAVFEEQRNNPELGKPEVRQRISDILTEEQRAELREHRRPPHRSEHGDRPDCDKG